MRVRAVNGGRVVARLDGHGALRLDAAIAVQVRGEERGAADRCGRRLLLLLLMYGYVRGSVVLLLQYLGFGSVGVRDADGGVRVRLVVVERVRVGLLLRVEHAGGQVALVEDALEARLVGGGRLGKVHGAAARV